jgi:hypothetical protein
VNVQQSSGRHVALGALAGALAGAMLFYTTGYPCSGDVMFCEMGFVGYGAIGAVAGGFAGNIISGARSRLSSLGFLSQELGVREGRRLLDGQTCRVGR